MTGGARPAALPGLLAVGLLLLAGEARAGGLRHQYQRAPEAPSWSARLTQLLGRRELGRSYALVLGVGDYAEGSSWRDLRSPAVDALRMHRFLVDAGFDEVLTLTDDQVTKEQIERYMVEVLPDQLGRDDRFLFYFSGHGTQRTLPAGVVEGYLPLTGSGRTTWSSMISMGEIARWHSRLRHARHLLFVLDSCFSGLAGVEGKGETRQLYLDQLLRPSHLLLTAGSAGQVSVGDLDRWGGSLFTDAFLRGARGDADARFDADPPDGVVSVSELLTFIQRQLAAERSSDPAIVQQPLRSDLLGGASEGEFFFLASQRPAPPPPRPAPPAPPRPKPTEPKDAAPEAASAPGVRAAAPAVPPLPPAAPGTVTQDSTPSPQKELETRLAEWPVVLSRSWFSWWATPMLPDGLVHIGEAGTCGGVSTIWRDEEGLRIGGGQSPTVVWMGCAVAPPFLLSVLVQSTQLEGAQPSIWLLGPDSGANARLGAVLDLQVAQPPTLTYSGQVQPPPVLINPFVHKTGQWVRADVLVEPGRIRLYLDGILARTWADLPAVPEGPLYSFFGLGGRGGTAHPSHARAALFRDLIVRYPGGKCAAVPRALDPPASSLARPGAECRPRFDYNFTLLEGRDLVASRLGIWTDQGIRLAVDSSPTSHEAPVAWFTQPLAGDFTAEVLVALDDDSDSVNLRLMASLGNAPPNLDDWDGWRLTFPTATGQTELRTIYQGIPSDPVAIQDFYGPVRGRDYWLGVERRQGKLRIWSNGGLLLEAADPWAGASKPIYLGLGKLHGGLLIKGFRVWTGCPPAKP